MTKFKYEKNDFRIHGHSGRGRISLIGKTEFSNLTFKVAAPIIGEAVIRAADKLLSNEDVHYRDYGVEIEVTFKTYKRNGTENNT